MMTDDERTRIADEARRDANLENRVKILEENDRLTKWAVLGAVATIMATIWDQAKAVIFHGN